MGDRCLQGVEAIVERQERVAPEGDDDGLVCGGEHRGAGSVGPVRRSWTELRFLHLAIVLGLTPYRLARALRLVDYLVLLDGPPLSSWRSRVEPVP